MLGVLGLSQAEQELYEQMVGSGPLAATELDGRSAILLDRLHELGLVSRIDGDPPKWTASPPKTALQLLVSDRGRELAEARRYVAELMSRFSVTGADRDLPAMVEVVYGRDEIIRRFRALQLASRHQFRACDAPPYPADDAAQPNALELDQLYAGLRFRILYDRTALDIPGRLADLEAGLAAGEQARVADIPLKMTLFDDTAAILPLRQPPDVESRLLVYNPVLLDALSALFEMYWDQALPLQVSQGRAELSGAGDEPPPGERQLLVLLVAGLTDQDIATQLGISDRTVRSRVRAMMDRLDATTRFQAGYQAVLRGWLTTAGPADVD
jgi:Bacterial regulatory proteins, luxR family